MVMAVTLAVLGAACHEPTPDSATAPSSTTTVTSTVGTSPSASERAATTVGSTSPAAEGFEPAPVSWKSCSPSGYQCGSVEVPLDYGEPNGPRISLGIKRKPAGDPNSRIGSLFFNPGGPGASGVESLPGAVSRLSDPVKERFDVVAWDPRGVGESAPIRCDSSVVALYEKDLDEQHPSPDVEQASKAVADECASRSGDLLAHVGTIDTARDLDSLRKAVADDKLNYLGVSYGTLIGLVYAEMYPANIRAMIIDGVVDPTLDPYEANLDQSKAVDRAIGQFVEWCKKRSSCPLKPDPAGALDELQAEADAGRVAGTIQGEDVKLSPTLTSLAVITATYDEASWPTLAQAVRRALDGDGSAVAMIADSYLGEASLGANNAINCIDAPKPTQREIDDLLAKAQKEAPRVGLFNANAGRVCEHWQAEPKPIDRNLEVNGSAPIMVWGTTGDNATPYDNAVHVASLLPGSRLVTLDANRHAAIGENACVNRIFSSYLVDLDLPPSGTRC